MADEVDAMMAYIEGRTQKTAYPCFTKQALNELELGIQTLADNCRTVKVSDFHHQGCCLLYHSFLSVCSFIWCQYGQRYRLHLSMKH